MKPPRTREVIQLAARMQIDVQDARRALEKVDESARCQVAQQQPFPAWTLSAPSTAQDAIQLAARAKVTVTTARRALREGTVRGWRVRMRIRKVMEEMGEREMGGELRGEPVRIPRRRVMGREADGKFARRS